MANVNDLTRDITILIRKCPAGVINDAYVRAARDFCGQSRWLRSNLNGATQANVQSYDLGTDPELEIIGVRAVSANYTSGNTQPWGLSALDSSKFDPATRPNVPWRYAYVPEHQIALFPTPDAVYSLVVSLQIQPKMGTLQIPDSLIGKWDRVLEAGALAYLYSIPGEPWTNPAESARNERKFQAGINNAKADEQRGYNTGTVRARPRAFVVGGM